MYVYFCKRRHIYFMTQVIYLSEWLAEHLYVLFASIWNLIGRKETYDYTGLVCK